MVQDGVKSSCTFRILVFHERSSSNESRSWSEQIVEEARISLRYASGWRRCIKVASLCKELVGSWFSVPAVNVDQSLAPHHCHQPAHVVLGVGLQALPVQAVSLAALEERLDPTVDIKRSVEAP